MTKEQQVATRDLHESKLRWLISFGWCRADNVGRRVTHRSAPSGIERSYLVSDAIALTESEPLRYRK